MPDFVKAYKLEMRQALESKFRFVSNFLIPILITVVFASAGSVSCSFCSGYTYFEYYASLIFATTVMFISMQLMVLRIVGERAPYGTLDRDLLAISRPGMYLGKLAAGMTIAIPQAVLMLIIAIGFYSMTMNGSPLLYALILILASIIGLSFGLLFSIASKTKEQAVQLVPFVILIFIVLAGELILFENMTTPLRQIAENLPLSLANQSLKAIMLHGKSFQSIFGDLVKLILWIVSLNVIGFLRFATEK